ncbi:hypothetical protein RRG55_00905 [Mycoplasmopsis felis]|uniref:hypothetical protein n=2 Tax=Mycoplasmopsis felis TaxID=33923 RepID=UPI002AFE45C5|nr:hypothetical protein [Mycoplasmopsis felis]WQQ03750.1 hypothetical protein RRG47_02875 [Mycoplasmopsis felis]
MISNSNKYDKNKKNMIFIRSSLFRNGAYKNNSNIRETGIKYFKKIEGLYPKSEYNYLFKLHPHYKPENSINYIKTLLGKEDISDYIVLNPSISWENMMSIDYYNLLNNQNESVFFKKENNKIIPYFKLFSLQATTTVLFITLDFLEHNIEGYDTLLKKKEVVDPSIIPINDYINIINRENTISKDYYQINK